MYRTSKKPDASVSGGDDLIVTREPIVGDSVSNIGRMFGPSADAQRFTAPEQSTRLGGIATQLPNEAVVRCGFSRAGFRHFVPPELGSGYWDFGSSGNRVGTFGV
jgi:hypothetical protein